MQLLSFETKRQLLGECRSIVLYGAGATGRTVAKLLAGEGMAVRAALDRRASAGQTLDGVPVLAPASHEARTLLADPETVVAITVFNRAGDTAEIRRTLEAAGCRRALTFYALHELYPNELGWRFWIAPRATFTASADRVAWLRELLRDERSRATLDALAAQRRSFSLDFPAPEPLSEQYVAPDLPALASPRIYSHFVDCGAYDGDTLTRMSQRFPAGALASCFEPDPANFVRLAERVRTGLGPQVMLWPCGVWDSTTQLHFSSGEGEGSHVATGGGATIQTVALDEALAGAPPPTYIKLDVEGAEPEALVGARRIIGRSRPVLALSAYHKPAHLWQLAELVDGWDLGYDFHLRTYGHQGFDTVLYAVPRGVML